MPKTLSQGIKKKKAILEYVTSSVKFPLHLYNSVAIKEQFPVSKKRLQSTLCYQMLPRRSGMLQMVLLLPGSPRPWGTGTRLASRAALCLAAAGQGLPEHPLLLVGQGKSTSLPGCAGRAGGVRAGPFLQECAPRVIRSITAFPGGMVCVAAGDMLLAQGPSSRLQWRESCLTEHP